MTSIVTVNVTQTVAPIPSRLQETGAFISQGGTTLASGASALLTQLADLTPILGSALANATIAWSGGVATVTTAVAHGLPNGDVLSITIAGAVPVAYNGTYDCTVTGVTTFTYAKVANPGAETSPGTWVLHARAELLSMATTFFAQGSSTAVYVLELGAGEAATGVATLQAYITANPNDDYTPGAQNFFYSYLVPRNWADEQDFIDFLADYESTTARTYFFVTMTLGNYTDFTVQMKDVCGLIEAPATPATEFSLAAAFYVWLHYNPSTTNKVTPFAFSFLFGVTPYPVKGNKALLQTLQNAFVNIVGTGAEGGISGTILLWGRFKDGRPANYWYSVDWAQITVDIDLSNEIINGSNNPQAPLFYNQDGINRLQARAQATMTRGVSYGLVLAPVTVTAIAFAPYVTENESDYREGIYNGLAVTYTPARGFESITFNVNVTDFPTV